MDITLLVDKIKRDKGFDLSGYRDSTLTRRIERRIKFDGAKSLDEYMRMIDRDYHLYWRLVSDFFIGVTDFFRDKEICDIVQTKVFPELIERRIKEPFKAPFRVWSAGCSTGEEVYSLAIMVKEIYEKKDIRRPLAFVHGTDILEDKLEQAKQGIYPREKVEKMERTLREKYFITRDRKYKIHPTIESMTHFNKLDLVHPSGFGGFDIIVCRNVLIYFQRKLQEKVIAYFHKALRPEGILWLGKSETLWGRTSSLFESVYKKERVFRKLSVGVS
ncbi:MAG: protein-glutamate O-methyltransferase CheR [Candidatus Omnitrophota bacterium]